MTRDEIISILIWNEMQNYKATDPRWEVLNKLRLQIELMFASE